MVENQNRVVNFTSSQIWKLMTNGKAANTIGAPGRTYIEEKKIEMRMGRSIHIESYSRSMAWGNFLEARVFDLLEFGYELTSDKTDLHPTISGWSGSKDLIVPAKKIADIKCYEPKNFAQLTDVIIAGDLEKFKEEFPQEYWQLVSNAIINQVPVAETITYMPYFSELEILRDMAENYDGEDQWKYRFIAESPSAALAYLPDGGYYKNLNRFEFTVPQADIDALTARVMMAKGLLNS